jgi:hypothetical protein
MPPLLRRLPGSLPLLPLLLLLLLSRTSTSFRCIHDALQAHAHKALTPPHSQAFPEHTDVPALSRALAVGTASSPATPALAPLRITPVFVALALSAPLSAFLTGTLVPAAIAAWQQRLTTAAPAAAAGPLFAHRDCLEVWSGTPTLRCATFAPTTYCVAGFDGVELPLTPYLGTDFYYPRGPGTQASVGPTPPGAGFGATDFALLVTAVQTETCGDTSSGSTVLAYAQTCQRDPATDRPTIGRELPRMGGGWRGGGGG